ncbi:MAG: tetratricopeptide repeat protein [Bacteroidales bacterium]|nr:tetratricopeptide repeat protein [Bacteroidales bacterium]
MSKVVSEKLGLHFPENRYNDLSAGISLAAKELGFEEDGVTFISLLIEQKLTPRQLDILAEKLTIGETYFFREEQILSAFREMIIPSLVKEREHTSRSIRIWSAGCCSGEEPYTLAMMLCDTIPHISSWNISILATDINRRFLAKATKGRYTPWSFRETPVEMKKKHFTPMGREFEISEEIRNRVMFLPLNLVEDPFPSDRNNTHSMDVIFCRNVLMYFSTETATAVSRKFYNSLSENGWLVTSQVELSDEIFHLFRKVNFRNSFLYQKSDKPVEPKKSLKITAKGKTSGLSSAASSKLHLGRPNQPAAPVNRTSLIPPAKQSDNQEPHPLELAIGFANKGNFILASEWAEKSVAKDPSNPEAYYLLGMIHIEMGEFMEAERQLKKALYLAPDHLLSHFQMATICNRNGKEKQARKHLQNVVQLLHQFQDEDSLPGTEGMTAGQLRSLLKPINTTEDA